MTAPLPTQAQDVASELRGIYNVASDLSRASVPIPTVRAAYEALEAQAAEIAELRAELAALPVCSEHEAGLADLPVACVVCEINELRGEAFAQGIADERAGVQRVEGWAEPYEGINRMCYNFDPDRRYVNP